MDDERITAVGLLTQRDVETLGPTFKRLWPIDHAPSFIDLLSAIDDADALVSSREISDDTELEPWGKARNVQES